jgi:hypothetical protein
LGLGPTDIVVGVGALVAYVALVALDFALFPPETEWPAFLGLLLAMTALLIAVCWLKGEPPRWRWGEDT